MLRQVRSECRGIFDARIFPLGDGVVERHAGTATEGELEAAAKTPIHPAVDDGVVAAVAHGKPVARDPDGLDELERVNAWVRLAEQCDGVERKPAQTVDDHHCNCHLHQLQRKTNYE